MKTFRILALTSLVAGFGLMTGCDSTSSSSAPEITEFGATIDEAVAPWTSGTELEFYGKATDDNSLTNLKLEFIDAAGKATAIKSVAVSGSSVKFGINEAIKFQITNPGNWAVTGSYKIRLTATDNDGLTSSKDLTFKQIDGTGASALTQATVTLGSNNNATAGSSLDADAMASYKISEVTTALQGEVDAYYAYSSTDKADKFFSPSQAKTSGFDGIKNWAVSTSVQLYNLGTLTETAFAAVNSQAAIDALFTGKTAMVSVNAAADVVVGIKTSKGAMRIIRVNAITPGAAGTVTIKGYK